ncbi:MAG: hypothetical protein PQJ45_07005 [Sphaerochaetaceae bacterium]|nr:hypothetical protein [Sphaerochaetaceae bacterium]
MSYKKENDIDWDIVFRNSLPGIKKQFKNESLSLLNEIENGYNNGKVTIQINNRPEEFNLKNLTKADFTREIKKYYHGKINKTQLDRIVNYIWKKKESDEKRCIGNIDDGFSKGLFGNGLVYSNPKTQNFFFIHGAFHIYQGKKEIHKITKKTDKALYRKIE